MSMLKLVTKKHERRIKKRFPIHREMRYKLLKDGRMQETGTGRTINIGSGGVAFSIGRDPEPAGETYVELSIAWPVLLDERCAMRLIIFGRLLRSSADLCVCTVDKWEFRTQSRTVQPTPTTRNDSMLERWAETVRKENLKGRAALAIRSWAI